jgi:pimeloyl-ACP methyl ester carboxylesterase
MNWRRFTARASDAAMCAMMYAIQRRHRLNGESRAALEDYIARHENTTRDAYFAAPPLLESAISNQQSAVSWASPITSGFADNDRARALLFPAGDANAHTVLFLHALMSASDRGYRRLAARFNAAGWNACFVHLPYHYSRTPRGRFNGELAITADLVRTAEGLRQAVAELRQLMAWLRARGCREFGVWALSYGGWIGALLASVERDFRFVALLEPIVDVEHAIWQSPTGLALRRQLRAHGIPHELIARHFDLTSPLHGQPLCSPERVVFAAGEYDTIARIEDIERLHDLWPGSTLLRERQGHFGYQLMPAVWNWLTNRGLLSGA